MNMLRQSPVLTALYATGLVMAFWLGSLVSRSSKAVSLERKPLSFSDSRTGPAVVKHAGNLVHPEQAHAAAVPIVPASAQAAGAASPNRRLAALVDYASKLDATQTLAALRKLDVETGPEAKLARHVLVARYAELNPLTALTYVETLGGAERAEQQSNALASWASRDAAKAAAYFEDNILSGGLVGDQDAQNAAVIAAEWARRDPKGAWDWVESLTPDARGEAMKRVATQLAATNPAQALQAVSSLPEAYERAEAMQPLASQWARSDPAKTASWVQSLRDPAEQASAATGLVSSWMQSNPYAVSEWVSKLPNGATRDAAIKTMIRAQAVRNDPETATFWAATVQDETLRKELVSETVRRWQVHDPEAAQRWLAANAW